MAAARESLPEALEAARAGDFRMETLVLVYQARFERAQGRPEVAREAAEAALRRAVDPVLANPFDEILARRALAPLVPVVTLPATPAPMVTRRLIGTPMPG